MALFQAVFTVPAGLAAIQVSTLAGFSSLTTLASQTGAQLIVRAKVGNVGKIYPGNNVGVGNTGADVAGLSAGNSVVYGPFDQNAISIAQIYLRGDTLNDVAYLDLVQI